MSVLNCITADIYEDFDKKYRKNGIETDCIGGGRILHEPNKSIEVYGYSQVNKLINAASQFLLIVSLVKVVC